MSNMSEKIEYHRASQESGINNSLLLESMLTGNLADRLREVTPNSLGEAATRPSLSIAHPSDTKGQIIEVSTLRRRAFPMPPGKGYEPEEPVEELDPLKDLHFPPVPTMEPDFVPYEDDNDT